MLQWMDDFTSYGTDAGRTARLKDGPYADNFGFSLQVDPDGTAGGEMVLRGDAGGTGTFIRKVLTSPQTTVGMAGRFWLTSLALGTGRDNNGNAFLAVSDVANIQHCYISSDASGFIRAFRSVNGSSTGDVELGATATPVVVTNAWRHIEIKVVLDDTAGSIEVRLEGAQVLNITGVKTTSDRTSAGKTASSVLFKMPQSSSCQMYVKDFIVWDGTGSEANTFLGSCQVYKIQTDADVSLNWTPSSGSTGFNLINDVTPDEDTNYISAGIGPIPDPAQFSLTDLPANTTSVHGVMTLIRSRKTDGGDGQLQASLVSGANTGNGADRTITTAYTYWWDMFDKDPSGVSWSRLLVNALNLKLNRTV